MLETGLGALARVVELAALGVIFWGAGVGLVGFVAAQFSRPARIEAIARVRCRVGAYLLLGLEILIASDIAQTAIEPTYERIALLGAVVAIRTVLSFFLNREVEAITATRTFAADH